MIAGTGEEGYHQGGPDPDSDNFTVSSQAVHPRFVPLMSSESSSGLTVIRVLSQNHPSLSIIRPWRLEKSSRLRKFFDRVDSGLSDAAAGAKLQVDAQSGELNIKIKRVESLQRTYQSSCVRGAMSILSTLVKLKYIINLQ